MAWPVSSAFLAALGNPVREWQWALHIMWTSNATEPTPTIASSTPYDATYMPAQNLVACGESRPLAVLDSGCLADGSWYPIPSEDETFPRPGNPGWWSFSGSDSDGQFATPPWVEVTYPSGRLRRANTIRVVTTRYYGPVGSVQIQYKPRGQDWTTLGTFSFGSSWYVDAELPTVMDLEAVRVEVLSTSSPQDHARLTEVDAIWLEQYDGSDLGRLDLTRRLEFLVAGQVPMGTLAASEVAAEILGLGAEVEPYLSPWIPLFPWWGLMTASGWEWVPQGIYFADEWECSNRSVRVRGRDGIGLLQARSLHPRLLENVAIRDAVRYLAHYAGLRDDEIDTTGSDTTTYDYLHIGGDTPARAMRDLMTSSLHHVWCRPDGTLRARKRTAVGTPIDTITDAQILSIPCITRGDRVNVVRLEWTDISRGPNQTVGTVAKDQLGDTKVIQGEYSKSPVISLSGAVVPGGSVNRIIGDEWSFTLTASGGGENDASMYGIPAVRQTCTAEAIDADSVRRIGIRELRITAPTTGATALQGMADDILAYLRYGRQIVSFDIPPRPHWEVGDVVTINSSRAGLSGNYLLTSISLGATDTMRLEASEL